MGNGIARKTTPRKMSAKREALLKSKGVRPFSTILGERKPIKKKPRPKKETERIYGPQEFCDYLHAHPCLGCEYLRVSHIQQAHVKSGGIARKDDWTRTGPLCGPHFECVEGGAFVLIEGCHARHDRAKRTWRTQDGETFAAAQKRFFDAWQKRLSGSGAREGGV